MTVNIKCLLFRTSFLVTLFFSFGISTLAQDSQLIDSLTKIVNGNANELTKGNALVELGKAYGQIDINKAIMYYDRAIRIGFERNSLILIGDGYNNKGFAFISAGDNLKAQACLDSAMDFHKRANNKSGIASALVNFGNLDFSKGEYSKALQYYLQGLKLREELNDSVGQGRIYNGIAAIYSKQRNYEKSLQAYRKGYELSLHSDNKLFREIILDNIANNLINLNRLDEAYETYYRLISVTKASGNKVGEANAYLGISKINKKRNKLKEALFYGKKAEVLCEETGNTLRILAIKGIVGDIYTLLKDYDNALVYYTSYYNTAKKLGLKDEESSGLAVLSQCYAQKNNFEAAYQHLVAFNELNDTLLQMQNKKHLDELQTKFETEKKQKENEILSGKLKVQELELKTNRAVLLGLIVLLVLSFIITRLIVRQNQLKAEQSTSNMKQQLLRTQMNPHFIFNSLTSIESFVYENEPKEAGKYLSDFARLMRLILENSAMESIPLSKEIKTLEYYLSLQKLRLEDKLSYVIKTVNIDNVDSIHIPPMLTQPFIENAIEHGFRGNEKAGTIEIEFKDLGNGLLQIQVSDNGKGIGSEQILSDDNKNEHKSMAIKITRERLSILNKSKKQKATFEISAISDENHVNTGTNVLFTIPIS
jgi:tetratricopeptide (TPR) repeat protein